MRGETTDLHTKHRKTALHTSARHDGQKYDYGTCLEGKWSEGVIIPPPVLHKPVTEDDRYVFK